MLNFSLMLLKTGMGRARNTRLPRSISANIGIVSGLTPIAARLTREIKINTPTVTTAPKLQKTPLISPEVASSSVFLARAGEQSSTPQVVRAPITAPPVWR